MARKLWKKTKRRPQRDRYFAVVFTQHDYRDLRDKNEMVFKSFWNWDKEWKMGPDGADMVKVIDVRSFNGDHPQHDVIQWLKKEYHKIGSWRYLTKKESALLDLAEM